jgi:hypothetical protein
LSTRALLYLCLLAFVITLAVIIGWRLADQAIAVIIGVLAGVAASVPTSLAVVWLVLQRRVAASDRIISATANPPPPPQVIIVHAAPHAPAAAAAERSSIASRSLTLLPAYAAPEPTALNGQTLGPRQFTIMGDDQT